MANKRVVCKSYLVGSLWCRQHDGTELAFMGFKSEYGKTKAGELTILSEEKHVDLARRLLAALAEAWPGDYIVLEVDDDATVVDVIAVVAPDDPRIGNPDQISRKAKICSL